MSSGPPTSQPNRTKAIMALLVAAFIFGATFVVVKSAVAQVDPFSFVAWRFLLGAVFLSLFALPRGRTIWWHGTIAGIALFTGYALQTAGLVETTASNSALITGLYVVITPLLAALFARHPPGWWSLGAAATSFAGLVLLTGNTDLLFETGDLLTVGCAIAFAFHIVALGRFARLHPVIPFTTVQLAVTAALAFPLSWWTDGLSLPPMSVWGAIVLTGIGVSALAYMLQIWAQTIVGAATAAIVVASESVFGVATGWIVLGERLDAMAWVGAGLIVASIFVVITKQADPSSIEAESVTPAH